MTFTCLILIEHLRTCLESILILASHLEQTTSLGTPNAQPLQVPTTQACRGLLANDFVLAGQNHGSSNRQVQHLPFPQCNKGKSLRIPARLQDVPNFDPQICSVFQIWCLIQVFIAFPGSPQGTHGIPKLAASQLPSFPAFMEMTSVAVSAKPNFSPSERMMPS